MKTILTSFGLWLVKQEWFQFQVVKLTTKVIETTDTDIDNKLLAFLKEHKRSLLTIARKEAAKTESPIDDRLVEALETVK